MSNVVIGLETIYQKSYFV